MFNTYALLKTAIANWLNRGDAATIAAIPGFIQLAEADIRADMESRHVTTDNTIALDDQEVTLPSDVGTISEIFITDPSHLAGPITLVTRSKLAELGHLYGRGPVRYASVVDGVLYLTHDPSEESDGPTATIIYNPQIVALAEDDDTNWFLTNHPNLYLYAALRHSAAWLRDDARKAVWTEAYTEHLSRMMTERDAHEFGSTPLVQTFNRGIGER